MSTQVIIVSNMAPPGLKRRSMLARGTTGVTGAVKGGLGGGLKGGAKGAAVGGLIGTGLAPLTFGASVPIGAAIGGAAGGALGAAKGAIRGGARGIRKFKTAPSVASQTYNERTDNMQTVCYVNNSEQRRVQTQMTLNRLNASMEPVEMITENSIGKAMKVGKIMAQRGAMKAGRKIKSKAAFTSKGLQRAAQSGAVKAEDVGRKIGSHVKKHKTAYQTAGAAAGGGYVGYKLKKSRGR